MEVLSFVIWVGEVEQWCWDFIIVLKGLEVRLGMLFFFIVFVVQLVEVSNVFFVLVCVVQMKQIKVQMKQMVIQEFVF